MKAAFLRRRRQSGGSDPLSRPVFSCTTHPLRRLTTPPLGSLPPPNRKAIKKGDRNRSRPDKRMPRAGPPEQKRCTPKIKRSPLQDSLPGWKKGFEPSTFGTTIRHSNQLSYIHHIDPPKHTPVQFPESVCKCNTFFRSVQAFSMKKRIFQGRHKRLFPKGRSACRIFFLSLPRMETPRTVRT